MCSYSVIFRPGVIPEYSGVHIICSVPCLRSLPTNHHDHQLLCLNFTEIHCVVLALHAAIWDCCHHFIAAASCHRFAAAVGFKAGDARLTIRVELYRGYT